MEDLGKWAFIIGLVIAVIAGLLQNVLGAATILIVLFVLGLVVGFLNVTQKETTGFLVAIIALIVVSTGAVNAIASLPVDKVDVITGYVVSVLENFIAFVGAAGLVVSIKAIVESGKN